MENGTPVGVVEWIIGDEAVHIESPFLFPFRYRHLGDIVDGQSKLPLK